jgi:hypothetical protein
MHKDAAAAGAGTAVIESSGTTTVGEASGCFYVAYGGVRVCPARVGARTDC